MISKLCHWVSWLAVVLAVVATAIGVWFGIIADGNEARAWAAFFFNIGAIPLEVGILVLGVIPSSVLFYRKRERRDWMSLKLAGSSFVIVLVEIVLVNVMPIG